jgi:hypothetical protein
MADKGFLPALLALLGTPKKVALSALLGEELK